MDDPELTRELAQLGARFSGLLTTGRLICTIEIDPIRSKLDYVHNIGALTHPEHYRRTKEVWDFMTRMTELGRQVQECMYEAQDNGVLDRLAGVTE